MLRQVLVYTQRHLTAVHLQSQVFIQALTFVFRSLSFFQELVVNIIFVYQSRNSFLLYHFQEIINIVFGIAGKTTFVISIFQAYILTCSTITNDQGQL